MVKPSAYGRTFTFKEPLTAVFPGGETIRVTSISVSNDGRDLEICEAEDDGGGCYGYTLLYEGEDANLTPDCSLEEWKVITEKTILKLLRDAGIAKI